MIKPHTFKLAQRKKRRETLKKIRRDEKKTGVKKRTETD